MTAKKHQDSGRRSIVEMLSSFSEDAQVGYRVEYVGGEFHVTPPAEPEHRVDIHQIVRQLRAMQVGEVECGVEFASGLDDAGLRAYVIPDATVTRSAPTELDMAWARAHDNYFALSTLQLALEVTSPSTRGRDFGPKLKTYAACGVDVYVIVDRRDRTVIVHSQPDVDKRDYIVVTSVPFGAKLVLPAPFGSLDTAVLL